MLITGRPAVTFASQAFVVARRTPVVSFFGQAIGFGVNYTPDFAASFDLQSDLVEAFDHAYPPCSVTLLIGGKEAHAEIFATIAGRVPEVGAG